jgi:hypothetical protein
LLCTRLCDSATHDITTYVIVSHGDWKNARTGRGDREQNVKNCF